MGSLHSLIEEKGKLEALRDGAFDRREIEAAAAYMAYEGTGVEFLYSGLCQAALPHRRLEDDSKGWQIVTDHIKLIVEPGMIGGETAPRHIGVPYGSRARLIMLYLQSEALRTGNPNVSLGGSMRSWLKRMGVPWGGKSGIAIRDQAMRISKCRISFESRAFRTVGMKQQNIVDDAIFLDDGIPGQGSLFPEVATLSQRFFESLQEHSVPLEEAAIRTISNNSMALDLYAWLAYRLWALKSPCPITWPALKQQFGQGFSVLRHFRATFNDNMRLALAVYREARVEVDELGVTLHPSPPPVRQKLVAAPRGKVPIQPTLIG